MSINFQLNGIIKYKKTLERYPSVMRMAIQKANEETAKEYMKLVYHEFDTYQDANEFLQIVYRKFDEMIKSHTGLLRRSLKLLHVDNSYLVGWFNDTPHYAKYVILGTVHMLPRNAILEAIKEIELPNRYLWQNEDLSQIGTVDPILSRGFDDPTVAKAFYLGTVMNLDSMVITRTGVLRANLEIRKEGDQYRVGWFENTPRYAKFVLMGTKDNLPRNPLIHAFDHEYLLRFMEKEFKKEIKRNQQ